MLSRDIKYVGGVGEMRAKVLEREAGVRTIGDLLMRFPFRYIDRSRLMTIGEVDESMESTYIQLRCRVVGKSFVGEGSRQRFVVEALDATGSVELLWFQGVKWIEKRIESGREYIIFGRPSFYRGRMSIVHPEIESVEQALSRKQESGFQGIYPSTEKLSQTVPIKAMQSIIHNAWQIVSTDSSAFADPLPEALRRRCGLI
ncbi:MAG: ATP-dependent DNA helicase RecG, partial [Alistipes sp.]|nr:ATP-dependent DNA helicase RecG [Alistipes sp.]